MDFGCAASIGGLPRFNPELRVEREIRTRPLPAQILGSGAVRKSPVPDREPGNLAERDQAFKGQSSAIPPNQLRMQLRRLPRMGRRGLDLGKYVLILNAWPLSAARQSSEQT